jgi:dihydrofolate reductase
MPLLDRIYLTKVDADIKGDKFFKYDKSKWKQISSEKHPADDKNQYAFEFAIFIKSAEWLEEDIDARQRTNDMT